MLKDDSDSDIRNENSDNFSNDLVAKLRAKINFLAKSVPESFCKKLSNDITLDELVSQPDVMTRKFKFACPVSDCCSFVIVSIEGSECLNFNNFSLHLQNHFQILNNESTVRTNAKQLPKKQLKTPPTTANSEDGKKSGEGASRDCLESYLNKCRCCLEGVKGDTYLKVTKLIEDRFLDFTLTPLTESDQLSNKICLTCNSLLARYSAIKESFIKNQEKLHNLMLPKTIKQETQDGNVSYTITEPLEEVKELPPWKENEIVIEEMPLDRNLTTEIVREIVGRDEESSKELPFRKNGSSKTRDIKSSAERFVCHVCSYQTSWPNCFRTHLRRHNQIKTFACDLCRYQSTAKDDLLQHIKTHLPRSDPRVCFKCDFDGCEMTFRRKRTLRRHVNGVHLKQRPFVCNLCAKAFSVKTLLERHVKVIHQQFIFERIPCNVPTCKASFTSKSHLNRHVKVIHQKIQPEYCDIEGCGSSFSTKTNLLRHKENIHKFS